MTKARSSLEFWSIVTVGHVGCYQCVSGDYKKRGKLKGLAFVKHGGTGGGVYYCRKHAMSDGCPIVGARLRKSSDSGT